MSVVRDLRTVIELACLTEGRSNAEQLALLRVALRVDLDANKLTVTNGRDRTEAASRLVEMVHDTRVLVDTERQVWLKPAAEERWRRSVEAWDAQRRVAS